MRLEPWLKINVAGVVRFVRCVLRYSGMLTRNFLAETCNAGTCDFVTVHKHRTGALAITVALRHRGQSIRTTNLAWCPPSSTMNAISVITTATTAVVPKSAPHRFFFARHASNIYMNCPLRCSREHTSHLTSHILRFMSTSSDVTNFAFIEYSRGWNDDVRRRHQYPEYLVRRPPVKHSVVVENHRVPFL